MVDIFLARVKYLQPVIFTGCQLERWWWRNNWHNYCNSWDPSRSEQLWASAASGKRGAIDLEFKYVLVHITSYSTPCFWLDWIRFSGRKTLAKISVLGRCFGSYFSIWRFQNKVQGPKDGGNIVERCLNGLCGLGRTRFWQLLTLHREFLFLVVGNDMGSISLMSFPTINQYFGAWFGAWRCQNR